MDLSKTYCPSHSCYIMHVTVQLILSYCYCKGLVIFKISLLVFQNVPAALYTDPNEISQHLTLKLTKCEKLELPETGPQPGNTEAPQ